MKRGILAVAAVFVAWWVLDYLLHMVILSGSYQETAHLWSSQEDMKTGLMLLNSLIIASIFVYIYAKFFARKGTCTGVTYGLLVGISWGISMGYGSYSVMPIPYHMALAWFLGTVVKMTLGGLLLGLIIRDETPASIPAQ